MKATTWLCPVLTLLCATRLVCTAQRGGYPLDYADTNMIQDDYMLEKRNKPSLSIVNPLDVLRQRLLLEIARRQMKENTRQVELNRAILKNVGKRMSATGRYQMSLLHQQQQQQQLERQYQHQLQLQQQQQQQQQQRQQLQSYFPNQLDGYYSSQLSPASSASFMMIPSVSIFDFLQQRRRHPETQTAIETAAAAAAAALNEEKKSLDSSDDGNAATKYQQQRGNGTNHKNINSLKGNAVSGGGGVGGVINNGNAVETPLTATSGAVGNGDNVENGRRLALNIFAAAAATNDDNNVIMDDNDNGENVDMLDDNPAGGGYQLRYLYRLHKNHYANK